MTLYEYITVLASIPISFYLIGRFMCMGWLHSKYKHDIKIIKDMEKRINNGKEKK